MEYNCLNNVKSSEHPAEVAAHAEGFAPAEAIIFRSRNGSFGENFQLKSSLNGDMFLQFGGLLLPKPIKLLERKQKSSFILN